MNETIPWVEKYRPQQFDDIVLDKNNKQILVNLIKNSKFYNLLFYGPPGTGKTTTIINLLKKYQQIHNQNGKDLIIHLNASDERGIEVIRNQIQSFVDSKNLFNIGHKFVILDEVDYMTKNAQRALRYLIDVNKDSVSFCLICNYITKIDISLREEFINIRFNQLPTNKIIDFLETIAINENIQVNKKTLHTIQRYFGSDIRSMINYLQSNSYLNINNFNLIDNSFFTKLMNREFKNVNSFKNFIYKTTCKYNISKRVFLYELLKVQYNTKRDNKLLKLMISVFHSDINVELICNYIFFTLYDSKI